MRHFTAVIVAAIIVQSFEGSFSFSTHVPKQSRNRRGRSSLLKSQEYDVKNEASSGTQEFNQLKIAFVTGNEMKAREVNLILAEEQATKGPTPESSLVDLRIVTVDLPEIQEINTEAIAKSKAILAAQLCGGACVVEDTSLQFNALGGMVSNISFTFI